MDKWFSDSGKRVAVVGSGVAGLAAARQLALLGHKVTVYEKHHTPGGMMNQSIPAFRLPRELIAKEVEQITALGVEIVCNSEIGKTIALSELTGQNDAVGPANLRGIGRYLRRVSELFKGLLHAADIAHLVIDDRDQRFS